MTLSTSSNRGPLGPFLHSTPLMPRPHDPFLGLASHCIRDTFGPTVQLTADALQSRGGESTLRQILSHVKMKTPKPARRLGLKAGSSPTDAVSVRASLMVLIQHSIVTVQYTKQQQGVATYTYKYQAEQAIYIPRYGKYIEYVKKALDATAACVVETLLLAGRLRTVDLILQAVEREDLPKSDRYTDRQMVVDSFWKLTNGGFLQLVEPIKLLSQDDDEEAEFEEVQVPPHKKAKVATSIGTGEDPAAVTILTSNSHYKSTLPVDAVWRVNIRMLHDSIRAFCVGRLVAEVFGHKVQSAGSLVTAALKYRANQEHVEAKKEGLTVAASDISSFAPQDIVHFLPKTVVQGLEKKMGGVTMAVSSAWEELSVVRNPTVVRRVGDDRYEIACSQLVAYLRKRTVHQIVHDRHGEVAARVVSILGKKGWLESDNLASFAMIPAKDTREVLHQLYRSQYVELFQLANSRQHNPASTIYLWLVHEQRLVQKAIANVASSLWYVRLRRQHQIEIGKDWIERAQQADDTDENDHEMDKVSYEMFCLGLERLDCSTLQLDETLMVLQDF
jgi:DNA-directed RNA polymerase III subunit RPC3